MNLLTYFQNHGRYVKVSTNKGGEYHGPCPKCGGNDRFIIWPERNGFWCRKCDWKGDDIEALRVIDSLSCKEAFARVGRECRKENCPAYAKCTGRYDCRLPTYSSNALTPILCYFTNRQRIIITELLYHINITCIFQFLNLHTQVARCEFCFLFYKSKLCLFHTDKK